MSETTADEQTLWAVLQSAIAQDPAARLVAIADSLGSWFDLGAAEYGDRVSALARGLLAADLAVGDAIAVLCSTRFEATLVDHAAWAIGVTIVPVDDGWSQSDLLGRLEALPVKAVVVETARDFARFDEIHGDLADIVDVWQIGLGDLDKLSAVGREQGDARFDERLALVDGSAVALMLPGSTDAAAAADDAAADADAAAPVAVSQSALVGDARAVATVLEGAISGASSTLRILRSTDVFAHVTTLAALATGSRLGHVAASAPLLPALASFGPTFLIAHPETYRALEEALEDRAESSGRGPALRQALDVAVEHAEAVAHGSVPRGLKTRFTLADALVLRGLRKAVGGHLTLAVSIPTETALPDRLRHILRALDVRVLEAFGDERHVTFADG